MKKKSNVYVALAILSLSLWLTGCVSASPAESASLAESVLYQPPVLRLKAGQTVTTKDGQYRPQKDEVWHSDARFRQLEQEVINLSAALNHKP